MSRYCANCHGANLRFVEVIPRQYWRKECMDCGSTGPFAPTIDTSPSGLAKMSSRGIEISVARFCDEGES